jgi:hypothetical protein
MVDSLAVAAHRLPASELPAGPRGAVATRTRVTDSRAFFGLLTHLGEQTRAGLAGMR